MLSAAFAIELTLLIPLIGAVLIALTGKWPNLRETMTFATAVALFLAVIRVLYGLLQGEPEEITLVADIVPGLSIAFHSEPLGILFALLASFLWIITSMYSVGYMRGNHEKHQTRFYVCFAIALAAVMGVAFSANLLTLFIFYEMLTLSTWPLVTHKGDESARRGGRVYLGILLVTSIGFLLPAIIWTWAVAGTVDFTPGGVLTGHLAGGAATILLFLYIFGIGKAAIMPVHRWLPAAMVAPTPVSALLHAVAVVKAGVFTLIKVIVYIFGLDYLFLVPNESIAIYLAGFTVIAASVVALRQTNFKRMLAYSTISQLSYIVLAALVLTPLSEVGAAVHMVSHALGKITLFFTAGAVYVASKKTEVTQLRGIGRRMPYTMTAFAVGALSMIGVPPTAGFVSKWYMIAGAFQINNYFVLGVLVLSTALNAAYFLPIVFRAFFLEEDEPPSRDHGEAPAPMVAALCITASLVLLFFVFNGPIVDLEQTIIGVEK